MSDTDLDTNLNSDEQVWDENYKRLKQLIEQTGDGWIKCDKTTKFGRWVR